jgi:Stage II sporulation protein E (SpoIIE)
METAMACQACGGAAVSLMGCNPCGGWEVLTSRVATVYDNSAHGEDHSLVRALGDHLLLDAIMDGVTRRGGGQAARLVGDALATAPLTSADDVVSALAETNHRLYQMGLGRFLLTTVSTALCRDSTLSVVGVGDSPVFLIRSNTLHQLSNSVRGVFLGGRTPLVDLYRTEVTIEPGDRLILATDGVTDNITNRKLVDIVDSSASPDEAAEQLRRVMVTRFAEGQPPGPLRERVRYDDWTAIIRFFSIAGNEGSPESPGGAAAKVR